MAKTRMLPHKLRTSIKVASWPIEVRYFWCLLWGYVDDHGKAIDNALLVKSDCFPLDPDIDHKVIDGWLWVLADAGVIIRYTVDGHDYIAVKNWKEHQKPPHPTTDVLPGWEAPGAILRALHAPRMNDAGTTHEEFTHGLGLGLGLGLVKSGSGSGSVSAPTALDLTTHTPTFDDFWAIWPRTEGKADALKAWDKAIRKSPASAIHEAAREYSNHPHRPAKQFVPHGATWLNGERWNDGPPTTPEAERTKPTPTDRAHATLALARNLNQKATQ